MEINSLNARLTFDNARALLMKNVSPEMALQARLTSSYIRSEILLNTTNAQYPIQTLINQPNNANVIFNTEKRLALQDWFIVSQIGVFLTAPASLIDASAKLLTFPDPSVLTGGGVAAAYYALYNGFLMLTINNDKILPEWDLDRHLVIPFTQPAANAGYTASSVNYVGNRNGSIDGYYPCEPNLIFNGAANLDFSVNIPAALALNFPFSRLVIILRGVKAQNITGVR